MAQKYSYTIATAFTTSGGTVDEYQLRHEIGKSTIVPQCTKIDTNNGILDAWFDSALSGTEQTTLDSIVAAHNPMDFSPTKGKTEQSLSVTETTSTTYQLKQRVTIDALHDANYCVHWSGDVGNSVTKCTTLVRLLLDGATVLTETGFVNDNIHVLRKAWSGFQKVALTEGVHTIDIEFRSTTDGGAAQLENVYVNVTEKQ